jgi:hypothetical protein
MDLEGRFWQLSENLVERDGVTRSTMMGFPCPRIDGKFFASLDHKSGQLVVKLPADRVAELIATGRASPFAPAGRTFREWAAIPPTSGENWPDLLEEALAFVAGRASQPQ